MLKYYILNAKILTKTQRDGIEFPSLLKKLQDQIQVRWFFIYCLVCRLYDP
jgi:hypothetical protein